MWSTRSNFHEVLAAQTGVGSTDPAVVRGRRSTRRHRWIRKVRVWLRWILLTVCSAAGGGGQKESATAGWEHGAAGDDSPLVGAVDKRSPLVFRAGEKKHLPFMVVVDKRSLLLLVVSRLGKLRLWFSQK